MPIEQYAVYGVSFELAIIEWTIPSIAYTPETYRVFYYEINGTTRHSSQDVVGTTNLSSVNEEYMVVLRNLLPSRQYTYQISTSNALIPIGSLTANSTFLTRISGILL